MIKKLAVLTVSVGLITSLTFPGLALAGGGLISTEITAPDGGSGYNASPGTQFIVRPQVHLNNGDWCKNCPIKVRFIDPQSNDLINQSSDKTDENGQIYAKVISNIPGQRKVFSEVILPDGTVYQGSVSVLNYYPTPIYNDENVPPFNYPAPEVTADPTPPAPSFLPKPSPVKPRVTPNPSTFPTPLASSSSEPNEDLKQKVEDLQKKLDESNQKQSVLEKQLDQLITFIKSIFPFFK